MPNLRKCLRCNLQKTGDRFLPRHRIRLDCRPLQIDENIPPGENHRCLHCHQSIQFNHLLVLIISDLKVVIKCRVSKSVKSKFKY